ncbi:sugar porter family MFS transporter [Spirosoma arcticum]
MKANALFISLVAACGGLLFGFDTAVIAGVTPFIQPVFGLDALGLGWAVSSVLVGCVVGTQLAGRPSDAIGRKKTLLVTALFFLIGAVGSALATTFTGFILYRILGGIAVGAASALSPVYIAEMAPPAYRGRLVSVNQLALVVGILLAFFSNYQLVGTGANDWRWMLGVGAVPASLFFFCLLFVPESPRWLLLKGRRAEALTTLSRVLSLREAERELDQIEQSLDQTQAGGFGELVKTRYRRLLLVGIVLAVLQQATGINAILYYAPIIFEKAGAGTDTALLQTIAVGLINLIFTLVAMFTIDRIGRRPLLRAGALSMAVFLLLLSGLFFADRLEGYGVVLFILGFIASFAVSLGPATWVLISEIYPNQVRGQAVSVATLALWVANFGVSYTFPVLLARWEGGYTFLFYALINGLGFLFITAFVPETKGKSLEELEILLTTRHQVAH